MSKTIRGLQIEISGNTQPLNKALGEVNRTTRDLQSELRQVDRLLKLDPGNTDLIIQKQKILAESVENTKNKLETLKEAEKQAQEQFAQGKIGEEQYRAIQREVIKTEEELKKVNKQLKEMDWKAATDNLDKFGKKSNEIGKSLSTKVTAPIVALGGVATKTAVDFESAFAGVIKTVDATDTELGELNKSIRDMSKEIPATAVEIAGVAEAAGQLGIEVPNIMDFTRVMIDLGESTNMSADEAATALARFANITQMSQKDFDKLGSVIVDLGNNLATTEGEIVAMGLRLAGAGSQIGLTEAQIMSFAGALSSVGIEAQAGGSAFSKVMVDMQLAVETGSERLNEFANVAGMSASEFKQAFQEDASGAIIAFIQGLGNAEEQGKSAIAVLDEMGITEIRLRDALLRASGANDVFSSSIEMGNAAWEENIALTNEAEQRYKTSESQMAIFKNTLTDLSITFGEIILPVVMDFVERLKELTTWVSNLSPEMQQTIVIVAGLAAAIGPLLIVIGQMSLGVSGLIKLFAPMIAGLGGATGATGGLSAVIAALTGPIGIAIAAIVAITAIIVALWKTNEDFRDGLKKVWENIKNIIDGVIKVIKGIIQAFIGLITGDWTKFTEGLKKIWEGLWQAIKNIVAGAWNLLSTAFNTLKNSISGFFTGMARDAINWGKNMIGGFIDGIKSMGRAVGNAVSGVVGGVKDFLGFNSPTKKGDGRYIVDWGSNMISGFIDGINKSIPDLEKTMKDVIPSLNNTTTVINKNIGNVDHTGTITVKGVNNQNELMGIVDIVMDELRREVRA